MADQLCLRGLVFHGRHGVLPSEREMGQDFVVDVVLAVDTTAAAASDDLSDAVDYARLTELLGGIVEGEPVNLIETLANQLADACLAGEHGIISATVTVHKPSAPISRRFSDISVTVTRSALAERDPHASPALGGEW